MQVDRERGLLVPNGFSPDETWNMNVTRLKDGHEKKDWESVRASLLFFLATGRTGLLKTTTNRLGSVLPVLMDLLTDTETMTLSDVHLTVCAALEERCSVVGEIAPPEITVSFERMYEWYKNVVKFREVDGATVDEAAGERRAILSSIRWMYTEEDGMKVFDMFKDRIGSIDSEAMLVIPEMLMFLSYRVLPNVIDKLLVLLDDYLSSAMVYYVFHYIAGAVQMYPFVGKAFDWKPYIPRLFSAGLMSVKASIEIAGKDREQAASDRVEFVSPHVTRRTLPVVGFMEVVCGLLTAEYADAMLDSMDVLVRLLEPMVGPERLPTDVIVLVMLIERCLRRQYKKRETVKRCCPESGFACMTLEQTKRFVKIMIPIVRAMTFELDPNLVMRNTVEFLAGLDYESVHEGLLMPALVFLDDPEMGEMAIASLGLVAMIVPYLMCEPHLTEHISLVPRIFNSVMPHLSSASDLVCRMSFRVVVSICKFLYIDEHVDKLDVRSRMVANTVLMNFEPIVAAEIAYHSSQAQCEDDHKNDGNDSHLRTEFFGAYSTSFIESKLKWVVGKMVESHHKSKSFGMLRGMITVHTSLLKKLLELVAEKYRSAPSSMKGFWASAMASVCSVCPELMEVIPIYRDLLKGLVEDDDKEHFNRALFIVQSLTSASVTAGSRDVRCAPLDPDVRSMWGRIYQAGNIDPAIFVLSDDQAITIGEMIMEVFEPVFDKIDTFGLEEQTVIVSVMGAMGRLFMRRGDIRTFASRYISESFNQLSDKVYTYARTWIQTTTNGNLLTEMIRAIGLVTCDGFAWKCTNCTFRDKLLVWRDGEVQSMRSRHGEIVMTIHKQNSVNTALLGDRSDKVHEFIETVIVPHVFNEYAHVREAAISFLSSERVSTWHDVFAPIFEKACGILECEEKTEQEFCAALNVLSLAFSESANRPDWFVRQVLALVRMKYDKSWDVDGALTEIVGELEFKGPLLRRTKFMEPAFVKVQEEFFLVEKESIPALAYAVIAFAVASGPAPVSMRLFEHFWNALLSCDEGRKATNANDMISLLWIMRPRGQFVILDHFPDDQYMLDNAAIGFCCEPAHAKVRAGPSVFPPDYRFNEARDWLVAHLSVETVTALIVALRLSQGETVEIQRNRFMLWASIAKVTGPIITPILDTVVVLEGSDIDPQQTVILTEIACGLSIGSRTWSREDAMAASVIVSRPIKWLLAKRNVENGPVLNRALHTIAGDSDWRRNTWLIDLCKEMLASPDEGMMRNGLVILVVVTQESHPIALSVWTNIVRENVLPRIHPLSKLSKATISELSELMQAVFGASATPLEKYDFGMVRILVEDIFDKEIGVSNDKLAIFLGNLHIRNVMGGHRFVPFIAERITQMFMLRQDVTVVGIPPIEKFLVNIGRLPWFRCEEMLNKALRDLAKLYPSAVWFIRAAIMHFVHMLCFRNLLSLSKDAYELILHEVLPLFVQDEKDELRHIAVRITRLLIPVNFSSLGEFYEKEIVNQKNEKVGCANAVSLLGTASILGGCPPWLPGLFTCMETMHRREPWYSAMIEEEFTDFWKRAGVLEVPEIEDFRYTFSKGYFA